MNSDRIEERIDDSQFEAVTGQEILSAFKRNIEEGKPIFHHPYLPICNIDEDSFEKIKSEKI